MKVQNIKPFIKWVGGKTQILPSILTKIPADINNYHEPFLGGGSVLFALLEQVRDGNIRVRGQIYAYDINPVLIATYQNIQSPINYPHVCHELVQLQTAFDECPVGEKRTRKAPPPTEETARQSKENYYYWIRQEYNQMSLEQKQEPRGSAMFIFMNKTGFRGAFREGPRGFNIPYGNPKNVTIFDPIHFDKVRLLVEPVIFQCGDFSAIPEKIQTGDFVYLDPPYVPENAQSFVNYTAAGFSAEKHCELFRWIHDMTTMGIHVVMSNADMDSVRQEFPEPTYHIQSLHCRRAIHSKNPGSITSEVIISNRN